VFHAAACRECEGAYGPEQQLVVRLVQGACAFELASRSRRGFALAASLCGHGLLVWACGPAFRHWVNGSTVTQVIDIFLFDVINAAEVQNNGTAVKLRQVRSSAVPCLCVFRAAALTAAVRAAAAARLARRSVHCATRSKRVVPT
jgi:hypothetical protein